jgi:hypothetical protein
VVGPVVCIGGSQLVTNDPDIPFRINGARSEYWKSDWYKVARLDPKHDNVSSELDEKRHMALQSKMSAGVSRSQSYLSAEDRWRGRTGAAYCQLPENPAFRKGEPPPRGKYRQSCPGLCQADRNEISLGQLAREATRFRRQGAVPDI